MKRAYFYLILLVVFGCSKAPETSETDSPKGEKEQISLKTQNSYENSFEGIWATCIGSGTSGLSSEEDCLQVSTKVWHIENGKFWVLNVDNVSENACIPECFDIKRDTIHTKVIASGDYLFSNDVYEFDILDTTDEKNFPNCTISWRISDTLGEELAKWEFDGTKCDMGKIEYSTWMRKYTGHISE